MAKFKRVSVGSVHRGKPEIDGNGNPVLTKEGKPVLKSPCIKIYGNHTFLDGQYLNLESTAVQLENLNKAIASGKLSGDNAVKARERLNNIPDYVLFDIFKLEKNES